VYAAGAAGTQVDTSHEHVIVVGVQAPRGGRLRPQRGRARLLQPASGFAAAHGQHDSTELRPNTTAVLLRCPSFAVWGFPACGGPIHASPPGLIHARLLFGCLMTAVGCPELADMLGCHRRLLLNG
jgi:hypothetical protein